MRSELLLAIDSVRGDLETELAALDRISSAQADGAQNEARGQLRSLKSLRDQLVGGAKALPALRAEITAAVAAIHAYASELQGAASAAQNAASAQAQLQQVATATRATTTSVANDIFGRHLFDSSLSFASSEDEAEYRRRLAARERDVHDQLAKGTPQGDLNAAASTLAQFDDAAAYGAGANEAFRVDHANVTEAFSRLREASRAAGISTEEADRRRAGAILNPAEATAIDQPSPTTGNAGGSALDRAAAEFRAAGIIHSDADDVGVATTARVVAANPSQGRNA